MCMVNSSVQKFTSFLALVSRCTSGHGTAKAIVNVEMATGKQQEGGIRAWLWAYMDGMGEVF